MFLKIIIRHCGYELDEYIAKTNYGNIGSLISAKNKLFEFISQQHIILNLTKINELCLFKAELINLL